MSTDNGLPLNICWAERKRRTNLHDHGLDFRDAASVFAGPTVTFEDDRLVYPEQRFITLGLLAGIPVSIAHMEDAHEIRIISFRKATRRERDILFSHIGDRLGAPRHPG